MNTKNLLLGVFVLLTIIFASLAIGEYNRTLTTTITSTLIATTTITSMTTVTTSIQGGGTSAIGYAGPDVNIPVPCQYPGCPNLPPRFVVGSYLFNDTSEGPPCAYGSHGGTITWATCVRLTFVVTATEMVPPESERVNFTWAGTFSVNPPSPSSAALFNGSVRMNWFVNSSLLYLHIATKWPPTVGG